MDQGAPATWLMQRCSAAGSAVWRVHKCISGTTLCCRTCILNCIASYGEAMNVGGQLNQCSPEHDDRWLICSFCCRLCWLWIVRRLWLSCHNCTTYLSQVGAAQCPQASPSIVLMHAGVFQPLFAACINSVLLHMCTCCTKRCKHLHVLL